MFIEPSSFFKVDLVENTPIKTKKHVLGQTEVVKEIARTTDVRNDLYCLQKRKVAILSSLEQRMKAEKRTGGDSRQVLSKCPAYYSNVTNTSANFLPVEGSGHKHPSRKETIGENNKKTSFLTAKRTTHEFVQLY